MGAFQSGITKSLKGLTAVLSVAMGVAFVKSTTKMAMAVESATDNITRNMGASAKAFQLFADTQSRSLGMAREDAYKYGSTFSNLLGSFQSSTKETADSTEELMRASAIIASKTGRTFDDVSSRIRSGMLGSTESIEDLGVYTQVSMLESTEAFKKFANGSSWAQLDFKLQQQIRLAAILEQTYQRYGDTLADTTQTKQARFIASLQNIKLNFGQAFLPIYNTVLPALTAFANKIESITANLAAFSISIFGKATSVQVIQEQTDAIAGQGDAIGGQGDAIEKAGKQAKKAIAPFDEINSLAFGGGGGGAGGGGAGGGGSSSNIEPVTIEASDKAGTFNSVIERMKEVLEPTIKALGRFKDALIPVGNFVWDSLKNFYEEVLKPIGKWVLGEGLPRLLDVGTKLLKTVDWDKLTRAYKNLYQALAPFVIGIGEGLVLFIEAMSDALEPAIASASNLLAGAINAIADAIKKIPEPVATAIGGAIGGIATAVLLFKGAVAVAGIVTGIKVAMGGLLATIAAHPVAAMAIAIGAIAGAVISLQKAKFNNSSFGKFLSVLSDSVEEMENFNKETKTMLDNHKQRKKDIDAEYGAIGKLADEYFDLADKADRTNEEKALMVSLADELVNKIPELNKLIDTETGSYKGTREEVEKLIGRTKEYYKVQAAKESLIEIGKRQYETERLINDKNKEAIETLKLINQKEAELEVIRGKGLATTRAATTEQKNNSLEYGNLSMEIDKLKGTYNNINDSIDETIKTQEELNGEWLYATDYIGKYSKTAESDMASVKNSVSSTLEDIARRVKGFQLPKLSIEIDVKNPVIKTTTTGSGQSKVVGRIQAMAYASGGFPDTGQMFIARESGPELVGKIGNSTAVANNDQIVSAVSSGVAQAVSQVMGSGGTSGDIVLSVGELVFGRIAKNAINKYNKHTGQMAVEV